MTTTVTRKPLAASAETNLVKAIDETFASESKEYRAAAVVWGRKQLKFEKGLRSTKPPVPAKLQNADKAKTTKTLRSIADAIGAKFEAPKATTAPAAVAPAAASLTLVKPDPKPAAPAPARRSSSRPSATRERKAAKPAGTPAPEVTSEPETSA